MTALRPELSSVLTTLLSATAETMRVELDALGEALGTLSVSTDEIDALMLALERQGRTIVSPSGGGSERHLGAVVAAARKLKLTLARPGVREVAAEAGLSVQQVLVALALLRVMQRSPNTVQGGKNRTPPRSDH